jgi:hypothetical protein
MILAELIAENYRSVSLLLFFLFAFKGLDMSIQEHGGD